MHLSNTQVIFSSKKREFMQIYLMRGLSQEHNDCVDCELHAPVLRTADPLQMGCYVFLQVLFADITLNGST